jgi:hypothetical protein
VHRPSSLPRRRDFLLGEWRDSGNVTVWMGLSGDRASAFSVEIGPFWFPSYLVTVTVCFVIVTMPVKMLIT